MTTSTESGNNSVVECDLAKVEVAGSNPVSRSIFPLAWSLIVHTLASAQPPLRRGSSAVQPRSLIGLASATSAVRRDQAHLGGPDGVLALVVVHDAAVGPRRGVAAARRGRARGRRSAATAP